MIGYTFTGFELDSMVYVIDLMDGKWCCRLGPLRVSSMIVRKDSIMYDITGGELRCPFDIFEDQESAQLECDIRNEKISTGLKIAKK